MHNLRKIKNIVIHSNTVLFAMIYRDNKFQYHQALGTTIRIYPHHRMKCLRLGLRKLIVKCDLILM